MDALDALQDYQDGLQSAEFEVRNQHLEIADQARSKVKPPRPMLSSVQKGKTTHLSSKDVTVNDEDSNDGITETVDKMKQTILEYK